MAHADEEIKQIIEQHFPGGFTERDEANAIVAYAFRNGSIENLHAGKHSELLENPDLSRITQEEMKEIMLNASRVVEQLLKEKKENEGEYLLKMMDYNRRYCRGWER